MSDIDARIAAALSTPTPSAEIAVVLDDAYTALRSAKAVSAKAQRDALDPLTPAAEVAAARQRAEDANFTTMRLTTAVADLNSKFEETQQAERESRDDESESGLASGCEPPARLKERYPALAGELIEILTELRTAEAEAQGAHAGGSAALASGWHFDVSPLALIKLPKPDQIGVYLWPR